MASREVKKNHLKAKAKNTHVLKDDSQFVNALKYVKQIASATSLPFVSSLRNMNLEALKKLHHFLVHDKANNPTKLNKMVDFTAEVELLLQVRDIIDHQIGRAQELFSVGATDECAKTDKTTMKELMNEVVKKVEVAIEVKEASKPTAMET